MSELQVKRLVYSFIKFLNQQQESSSLDQEARESLEVAIQCLETAYGVQASASNLQVGRTLIDIFNEGTRSDKVPAAKPVADEDKIQGDVFKNEGNDLMKADQYQKALESYTKAIQLDSNNSIYYCNRAAAYAKLNDHRSSIADCERAIEIDPTYSKAYGRKGVAHANMNQLTEARDAYRKALELEPGNESYSTNLQIAEEKLRNMGRGSGGIGGGAGLGGLGDLLGGLTGGGGGATTGGNPLGMDLGSLMSNPAFMNMATQMMSDPGVQQMMTSFVSNMAGGAPAPAAAPQAPAPPTAPPTGNFENLLQAGQNFASQIRNANPDLINQMRQFGQNPPDSNGPNDNSRPNNQQNPPGN